MTNQDYPEAEEVCWMMREERGEKRTLSVTHFPQGEHRLSRRFHALGEVLFLPGVLFVTVRRCVVGFGLSGRGGGDVLELERGGSDG